MVLAYATSTQNEPCFLYPEEKFACNDSVAWITPSLQTGPICRIQHNFFKENGFKE